MDAQNIQTVRNHAVREKISRDKLVEMETLEQSAKKIAQCIVQDAINCGDLDKKHQDHISTIVSLRDITERKKTEEKLRYLLRAEIFRHLSFHRRKRRIKRRGFCGFMVANISPE